MIGLGACDMKGALAATIVAAARADAGKMTRPVLIAATADEEISLQGAREVLERSELFRTGALRHGVIAEPTNLVPVVAHKGAALSYVTANGVAAHTSTDRGISANFLIAPFLAEMAELANRLQTDSSYHRTEFDPPTLGFNMTLNDGGCKQNVTAQRTVCTLCMRSMPNDRTDDVLAEIADRAGRYNLEVTTEIYPAFAISPDAEIVRTALAATGAEKTRIASYGSEATFYQEALELVLLGPGDVAQAHISGEWIAVSQLHDAVTIYSKMIDALCM